MGLYKCGFFLIIEGQEVRFVLELAKTVVLGKKIFFMLIRKERDGDREIEIEILQSKRRVDRC